MTRPLLDGRFSPITDLVGYIEAPVEACAEAVRTLLARLLVVEVATIEQRPVPGPLAAALTELVSATAGDHGEVGDPRPSGYLLTPTAGPWTAIFIGDTSRSVDPRQLVGDLPDLLGCRTVMVYAVGDVDDGIVGFTLAEPGRAGMLDAVRVVIVERRGGAPTVQPYGEPLPAEGDDLTTFDLARLDEVLHSLGIDAFDDTSYLPPGTQAVLLEL